MKTLEQFWHWADNEKPDNAAFMRASNSAALSQKAREAIFRACLDIVDAVGVDSCDPWSTERRAVLKDLSFAMIRTYDALGAFTDIQPLPGKPVSIPTEPFNTSGLLRRVPISRDRRISQIKQLADNYSNPHASNYNDICQFVAQLNKEFSDVIRVTFTSDTEGQGLVVFHAMHKDGRHWTLSYGTYHLAYDAVKGAILSCFDAASEQINRGFA